MTISIPGELQNNAFKFVLVQPHDKRPIETEWTSKNNYFFFEKELQDHLSKGGNYGILGGHGGLVIIDCDTEELAQVVRENLPKTFTVKTGSGGHHFYYFCEELKKPIRLYLNGENVGDIQSFGKMAVGPTSIHPNGEKYKVVEALAIAIVSEDNIRFAVRDYLISKQEIEKSHAEASKIALLTDVIDTSGFVRRGDELQGPHPVHGSKNGNNFCINTQKNIWHCFRCGTGGDIFSLIAVKENLLPCHLVEKTRVMQLMPKIKKIMKEKYKIAFLTQAYDAIDDLIQKTLEYFNIITLMDTDEMYIYDIQRKMYIPNGEKFIKVFLTNEFEDRIGKTTYNEILHTIQGKTYITRDQLNPSGLFPVQNGILDLKNKKLLPHSPIYYTTYITPLQWREEYSPNRFLEFLNSVAQPDDVREIQKMFAYCFMNNQKYQKAFLFVGSGSNGKSVLLNTLAEILGKQNISTLSLHEIEKEKFALPVMYAKMANICADLSSLSLASLKNFKAITGGDNVYLERKFREGTADRITAKLIFSANQIPYSKEGLEPAVLRRWVIFEFLNKFEGARKDPELLEKLTTEEEKSGILNWAMEGLKYLETDGGFLTDEKTRKLLIEYGDPILAYSAQLEFKANNKIKKEDLYINYCEFIAEKYENQKEKLTQAAFCRKIRAFMPTGIKEDRIRYEGKRMNVWVNLGMQGVEGIQEDTLILDED